MAEVKITFKGATPAAGSVIQEVLVEDPETHDRELFVEDTPRVVDEKWAALVHGDDKADGLEHHTFEVEEVTADVPAKSASRSDWDDAARKLDINPELYNNKDDLIEAVEAAA